MSTVTARTTARTTTTVTPTGARARTETVPVGDSLWRVIRTGGDLLGYIDRIATSDGDRFRVRRMLTTQRRFIAVGEFWQFDDALDCFRF